MFPRLRGVAYFGFKAGGLPAARALTISASFPSYGVASCFICSHVSSSMNSFPSGETILIAARSGDFSTTAVFQPPTVRSLASIACDFIDSLPWMMSYFSASDIGGERRTTHSAASTRPCSRLEQPNIPDLAISFPSELMNSATLEIRS